MAGRRVSDDGARRLQEMSDELRHMRRRTRRRRRDRPRGDHHEHLSQFTIDNNQTITANGTADRVELDSVDHAEGAYLYNSRVTLNTTTDVGAMTPQAGKYLCQYMFWGTVTRKSIGTVTNATNVSPIVLSCGTHSFAAGERVIVEGVGGNLAANDVCPLTAVTAGTLTLGNTNGSGAYTSGGTVTLVPRSPGVIEFVLRQKPSSGSYAEYINGKTRWPFPPFLSASLATYTQTLVSPVFAVEVAEGDEWELSAKVDNLTEDVTISGTGGGPFNPGLMSWLYLGP